MPVSSIPHPPPKTSPASPRLRLRLFLGCAVGLAGLTVALAQVFLTDEEVIENSSLSIPLGDFVHYANPTLEELAWSRLSFLNPEEATKLVDTSLTDKEREDQFRRRLAILDPVAYQKAGYATPLTEEEEMAASVALLAIHKPREVAAELNKAKSAATLQQEALVLQAMLNPDQFNQRVETLKSDQRKAAEAESARAVLQPTAVTQELAEARKETQP